MTARIDPLRYIPERGDGLENNFNRNGFPFVIKHPDKDKSINRLEKNVVLNNLRLRVQVIDAVIGRGDLVTPQYTAYLNRVKEIYESRMDFVSNFVKNTTRIGCLLLSVSVLTGIAELKRKGFSYFPYITIAFIVYSVLIFPTFCLWKHENLLRTYPTLPPVPEEIPSPDSFISEENV